MVTVRGEAGSSPTESLRAGSTRRSRSRPGGNTSSIAKTTRLCHSRLRALKPFALRLETFNKQDGEMPVRAAKHLSMQAKRLAEAP